MGLLSRWRPRHILLAWIGYWLALALVTVGRAIPAVIRATRPDAKGGLSAGMGDGGLNFTVMEGDTTTWSGTASLLELALWVAVPPVLLWLAWLFSRPRRDVREEKAPALAAPPPELFAPPRWKEPAKRETED
ncbi:MAG TPA: hypothetical protein VJ717_21030 [Gemmatimonadaceae bacterium]|nr:hypothetical protein [Gemmatimonadaceae bacterium]